MREMLACEGLSQAFFFKCHVKSLSQAASDATLNFCGMSLVGGQHEKS